MDHGALNFDLFKPGIDYAQAVDFVLNRLLNLGSAQGQHAANLFRRDVVEHHAFNLVERQAQLFQRQDPIEIRQLVSAVIAVAGKLIGVTRLEEADLVVISKL